MGRTKWKPKFGETFFMPYIISDDKENKKAGSILFKWTKREADVWLLAKGLVCKTEAEALELAKKMLAAAKECVESDLR